MIIYGLKLAENEMMIGFREAKTDSDKRYYADKVAECIDHLFNLDYKAIGFIKDLEEVKPYLP